MGRAERAEAYGEMLAIHASEEGVRFGVSLPCLHQAHSHTQDAGWEGEDKNGAGVRTALPHLPRDRRSVAGLLLVCTAVDFENH